MVLIQEENESMSSSVSDDSNDPDYEPNEYESEAYDEEEQEDDDDEEEEYDEEGEEGEEGEEDEDEGYTYNNNSIVFVINPHHQNKHQQSRKRKYQYNRCPKKKYKFLSKYNNTEKDYFEGLQENEKQEIETLENKLVEVHNDTIEPIRFKFLKLDIADRTKKIILSKLDNLNDMMAQSGEYFKLNTWISSLNSIPFSRFYELPVNNTQGNGKICAFLENVRTKMNTTIYGHKEAKEQIIRILAQLISFPRANGYVIGIQGSAGVGKTKLIKEGICNALNYPYAFISLGGATDASYLRGHSFTYEGATYGKITESLIKTGVMNPIFLFDELDKVSNTYKGDEIINTLIHITDPVQNDKYTDRYFEEIDIDISRAMTIFTYNDESQINPILKDRMITINVAGYSNTEKLALAQDFLIPEILKQYNLKNDDIIFSKEVIKYIIDNIEKEEGVRTLKRTINNIVSWVNMMRYVSIDNVKISFPFEVSVQYYDKYCHNIRQNINRDILHSMYV